MVGVCSYLAESDVCRDVSLTLPSPCLLRRVLSSTMFDVLQLDDCANANGGDILFNENTLNTNLRILQDVSSHTMIDL